MVKTAKKKNKKTPIFKEKDARKCKVCDGTGKRGVQDCIYCGGKGRK